MAYLEKANWVVLVVAAGTLVTYGAAVWLQLLARPAAEIAWVEPMAWSIVVFVVTIVAGMVAVAASNPKEADRKDQRDRDIDRFGERVANAIVVTGSGAGLILAMADADTFWIGNAIYLFAVAGSLGGAVTKVAAYHGPFQQW